MIEFKRVQPLIGLFLFLLLVSAKENEETNHIRTYTLQFQRVVLKLNLLDSTFNFKYDVHYGPQINCGGTFKINKGFLELKTNLKELQDRMDRVKVNMYYMDTLDFVKLVFIGHSYNGFFNGPFFIGDSVLKIQSGTYIVKDSSVSHHIITHYQEIEYKQGLNFILAHNTRGNLATDSFFSIHKSCPIPIHKVNMIEIDERNANLPQVFMDVTGKYLVSEDAVLFKHPCIKNEKPILLELLY